MKFKKFKRDAYFKTFFFLKQISRKESSNKVRMDNSEALVEASNDGVVMKHTGAVSAISNTLQEWQMNPKSDMARLLTKHLMTQGALVTDVLKQLSEAVAEDIVLSIRTMSSKEIEACNFEKYGVSASYTRACEEFEFRANLQLLLHAAMTVVTPHPLVASMIESIAVSCENAKIKEEMVHHLAIKRYKKFSPDIEFYKIQYTLKARDKKKSVLGQSASSYEVSYEIQIRKMNKGDEDRFLLDRRDYESKIQQDTILLLLKSVKIDFDQIILPDDDTKVDYALTVVVFTNCSSY